ncbi:hypothetical protein [Vibrio phage phiKT1028]|nr:hypothetical protein [Vibrio phage phiKT1028]
MIVVFVFMLLTGYVMVETPFEHNWFYTMMLSVGTLGSLTISLHDLKFGRRYHVTASYPDEGMCFRIRDRELKTTHELLVMVCEQRGAEVIRDYENLNRIVFRASLEFCDFNNLEMCLGRLVEVDRCTTSDNVFNLVKLIKHQSPVIHNTHLADYMFSSRARDQFVKVLRRAV